MMRLVEPSVKYKASYIDMLSDWEQSGEKVVPFVLKMDPSDFESMVNELIDYQEGIGIPETFVPHTTFWLVDENENIVGVVNIRHQLNEKLLQVGGHIGYGIRPSERRKGYATAILKLGLIKAKDMGFEKVLVTCNKDNIGSAKTIINNGGILESEFVEEWGNIVQRYWIEVR